MTDIERIAAVMVRVAALFVAGYAAVTFLFGIFLRARGSGPLMVIGSLCFVGALVLFAAAPLLAWIATIGLRPGRESPHSP